MAHLSWARIKPKAHGESVSGAEMTKSKNLQWVQTSRAFKSVTQAREGALWLWSEFKLRRGGALKSMKPPGEKKMGGVDSLKSASQAWRTSPGHE